MARFHLILPDDLNEEFYRCFPKHGARSDILRSCIHKLIAMAKPKLRAVEDETAVVCEQVMKNRIGD